MILSGKPLIIITFFFSFCHSEEVCWTKLKLDYMLTYLVVLFAYCTSITILTTPQHECYSWQAFWNNILIYIPTSKLDGTKDTWVT